MTSTTTRIDGLERNLIINGNMDFFQRGATAQGTNSCSADRFRLNASGAMSLNSARSTLGDVPTLAQSGFQSQYSVLATCTGGGAASTAGNSRLTYIVEGLDYAAIHGKPCRLQFWAKATGTGVTGTYTVSFRNAAINRSYVATYTLTAGAWKKITIDLVMDSVGTWAFDNTSGLLIEFNMAVGTTIQTSPGNTNTWLAGSFLGVTGMVDLTATTNNTFQLSQVMLIPTDYTNAPGTDVVFQRAGRTFAHELQMCQRYYEKSYDLEIAPGTANPSPAGGFIMVMGLDPGSPSRGFFAGGACTFKVPKRSNSVVLHFYAEGGQNTGAGGAISAYNDNTTFFPVASAGSSGQAGFSNVFLTVTGSLVVSSVGAGPTYTGARVYVAYWTADAEL